MNDADRIQGDWMLTSGERHGEKFTPETIKNVILTFDSDVLRTKNNDDVLEARFTLHPQTKPKGIDLNMDGSVGLGIYRIEGNNLNILHGEIEEPRPESFDAIKSGKLTLMVLKRASE